MFLGINWKVRFDNPTFIFQLFIAIAGPIGAYFGINYTELTTWNDVFILIAKAIQNPVVIASVVISIYNLIIDPTTDGVTDLSNK